MGDSKNSLSILLVLILIAGGFFFWRMRSGKTERVTYRYRCDQCAEIVRETPPSVDPPEYPDNATPQQLDEIDAQYFRDRYSAGTCPQCNAGTLLAAPVFQCNECQTCFEGGLMAIERDSNPCPKCRTLNTSRLPWESEDPTDLVLPKDVQKKLKSRG